MQRVEIGESGRAMFAKILINEMFKVQPGETLVITEDAGSDAETVTSIEEAANQAGALALVIRVPQAEHDGQAGMDKWPSEALIAALSKVDIWIEAQSIVMLYSDIWETVLAKNKTIRYLVIGETEISSLIRTFTGFSIGAMKRLLQKVRQLIVHSSKVRITSENGTDVSYQINPNYTFDFDEGDFSKPKFGTAPGYVNVVPKIGSMNGNIVFDSLMNADVMNNENHVEFIMEEGTIKRIEGNAEAEKFRNYLASFEDANMYKISHNMIGLNPGVRKLTGNIVEDERIWGGVDFGFGHTSPMDMPPHGQEARSHFDGVVKEVSIFLDEVQILDRGVVCHPDLKGLASELLGE
ncbi:hypothetical protein [Ekhidna sp.]|uniref:hypothetical protein n=1 Tax=Ekhidna sp. TaxID=2608089 RepID=UPI0032970BCB